MKHKIILFLSISFLFWGCSSSKSKVENQHQLEKNKRPSVIFILTDDQGSMDVNSYGAKYLVTPNMNYIIENGVSFTQFYASPVCSPSRAALLTGKTPQRAGLSGNAVPDSKVKKGLPGNANSILIIVANAAPDNAVHILKKK